MQSLSLDWAIQRVPDSQGKEGSLWPTFVILMDTRLSSRQKREWVEGRGGEERVGQKSNENRLSCNVTDGEGVSWKFWTWVLG